MPPRRSQLATGVPAKARPRWTPPAGVLATGAIAVVCACSAESLVVSPQREQTRHDAELALALSRHVEALAAVHRASVVIDRPPAPLVRGVHPPPRPSVSIVATLAGDADSAFTHRAITRLATAGVHGLDPRDLDVVVDRVPVDDPAARPPLVAVGPFRVATGSAVALQAALAGLLVVIIGLAVWVYVEQRKRATGSTRTER